MRLGAFEGDWTIERAIEDVHAARLGRFTGRATFRPSAAGGLAYREEGTLTLGDGPAMQATRDYHWRDGGGGIIEVRFGDGGSFTASSRRRRRRATSTSAIPTSTACATTLPAGRCGGPNGA